MERHTNKKLFAGFLALSAGLVLASCDPVSAIPTNYNNPVLTSKEVALDIDENKMGEIYDAVATEKNAKVVEKLLREVAEGKFGTFEEFKEARDDASKVEAFTKKYKGYFGTGSTATRRFDQFKQDVKDRINEFFYNEISNSSYEDELGKFSEEKFYNAKRYDLYDLDKDPDSFKSFFVDSTIDKTNAYDVLVKDSDLLKAQYEKTTARGYVKEKVYPDILKDKLVEDYVYRKNYNTLGRSYGREVNMIKLSYEGKDPFVRRLVEGFATKYIEQTKSTDEGWTYKVDYTYLVNAYKGFAPSSAANQLITTLGAKELGLLDGIVTETPIHVDSSDADYETNYVYNNITLVPDGYYNVETKLGALLKKYKDAIAGEKAGRFPNDDQKSALETFTSDGKSKAHGLFNEIVKLMKEDYTTDGWHVKASGLSDLPSALKDRLFNIRVANTLDKEGAVLEEVYSTTPEENTIGKWMYVDGDEDKGVLTRLPYIRNINGRKVVIPAKPSYKDREQNYVYEDVSGKSVTICQVLEAPSTSKLNKDQTTEYSAAKKELLARSIAKVLGTKDSYIKDAYTEYLNKYDFSFFDSSLYDYLKSEYPDLDIFDED
jgi:hypothetical protein